MSYKFFVVPIHNGEEAEQQLNRFVRGHRVLSVARRWVEQGTTSFWSFCIDYHDSQTPARDAPTGKPPGVKGKVDYREVLSPEDFAVFARLRDVRKEISDKETIPVYNIFNNEQLAQMVQQRASTRTALEKIAGVGSARAEKYGERMLAVLRTAWPASQPSTSEPTPLPKSA